MRIKRQAQLHEDYIKAIKPIGTKNISITYEKGCNVLCKREEEAVKILMLTDIHLGGSNYTYKKDRQALETMYSLISRTKPDLIVITGDMVYPILRKSRSLDNLAPLVTLTKFMDKIDIPWTCVFGNHDTEKFATYSAKEQIQALEQSKCLYSNAKEVTGRCNQVILIKRADNTLLEAVVLLDSNSYLKKNIFTTDYDYIRNDQVEWYEKEIKKLTNVEGKTISSLMFFHIPLEQMKEACDKYLNDEKEVEYLGGGLEEKVSCSSKASNLFEKAVELGSTKYMFFGHDHLNDISLRYKGIVMTYGKSIDFLAYKGIDKKTEQRGATLITIDYNGDKKIESIRA